jgi:hypothetical protein
MEFYNLVIFLLLSGTAKNEKDFCLWRVYYQIIKDISWRAVSVAV